MSDITGNGHDAEENKPKEVIRKEGSGKSSTSSKESTSCTAEQSRSVILGNATKPTVKSQQNQNNVNVIKLHTKKLVPMKDYKLIQKVEEKIVQEKSIRTRSPRRRRATLLHFAPTNELPDVARVQLLLSNISERPLQFKLKSEPGPDISALPSSKGYISAHGSAKCTLTWRREADVEKWSDAQQPKMLLVLDFLRDKSKNEKHTLTRLIGKVTGDSCDSDRPPVEQLMLDAASSEYSRPASRELMVLEQMHTPKKKLKEKKLEATPGNLINSIANWLNQQSKDSLLGLLLLIIFFYFLGTVNSSKQKRYDE